eukprot:3666764-Lingulodinium_polyedra.AAC.1
MTHQSYVPLVHLRDPGKARRAHRRRWKDTCLEISVKWRDKDTDTLRKAEHFKYHLAYIMNDVRRKNE